MKITTREQAVEEFGKWGGEQWDACPYGVLRDVIAPGVIHLEIDKRSPKLESLTDEGIEDIFASKIAAGHSTKSALRETVNAHHKREIRIMAQDTEEELLIRAREAIGFDDEPALNECLSDVIAVVRAHDRAKGQQYPEPRPVSEWTEEMGPQIFGHFSATGKPAGWYVWSEPCPGDTHFLPLPKAPK